MRDYSILLSSCIARTVFLSYCFVLPLRSTLSKSNPVFCALRQFSLFPFFTVILFLHFLHFSPPLLSVFPLVTFSSSQYYFVTQSIILSNNLLPLTLTHLLHPISDCKFSYLIIIRTERIFLNDIPNNYPFYSR